MSLNPHELVRLRYAVRLVDAQIAEAKKLHAAHFGEMGQPGDAQTLAAIIEALAVSYASAVAANVL